jgi:diadenosine tetraphosphate (Ap4A) HIT family hydrolase
MPTVFTRIIAGELPGAFVWRDDEVVAFLSINPITHGHTLVVPRSEVDHWLDLDPALWRRCAEVSQLVGQAIARAFDPPRVGQMIAGFEVPHVHVHVLQIAELGDLSFARAARDPDPAQLQAAAEAIRMALRDLGHAEHVPDA